MVLAMKQPNRALVAALDPFMIANGFKFLKSREAYFRKYDGGFDYFSWSTYPLSTGEKWKAGYHEGHYGIGKRVDKIEQLTRGEPERVPTLVDEWLSTINDWDKKTAGKRPPLIDDVARKLTLITDKAKVLGYLNSAH
jgi:hypothetical protein